MQKFFLLKALEVFLQQVTPYVFSYGNLGWIDKKENLIENKILRYKLIMNKDVCIVSALRTAVGSLGKSLKNIDAADLGSSLISETIDKLSLKKNGN